MFHSKPIWLLFLLPLFLLGCGIDGLFEVIPKDQQQPTLPIEIREGVPAEGAVAQNGEVAQAPTAQPTEEPTPTPTFTVTPTPTLIPNATPTRFFLQITSGSRAREVDNIPRHGLLIAFILPLIVFGIPWIFIELFTIRYVQPRGLDISTVNIKAQDGLFVQAIVSMTARRTLTLASTRMTWPRVREFVEKGLEQDLIQEAINYPALEDLERNVKDITEQMEQSSIIQDLARDFGVEIMRFNIEIRYTPETMDALQRKAEASAGGTAYLAYAAAAHLDPDRPESRELYRIYQETTSQVDAARNLGGGVTGLAKLLTQRIEDKKDTDAKNDSK